MQEGVIQYQLHYQHTEPSANWPCAAINQVRDVLFQLAMLGQDPQRYDGLGFGNISVKMPSGFLITGSQTGHIAHLMPEHFAHVMQADIEQNSLNAAGPCKPSSEALSHAACYSLNPAITAVIHVHDKNLWSRADISRTPADIGYGTVAMARCVAELFNQSCNRGIFAMQGHEDGVIAFATDLQTALQLILDLHQQKP